MKSAILLVVPRQKNTVKKDYSYMFPLGIGYVSAVLKKAGYPVDCLNLNHHEGTVGEIMKQALDRKKYDFVGTGNNALGYGVTEGIINAAKKHDSKPRTILGGPIITTEPDVVFNLLNPDFAVIGEGEETIIELLDHIENGKDIKNVRGVGFRDANNAVVFTERRESSNNLDTLPWPDFQGLGYEEYLENQHTNNSYSHNPFDYPRVYPIMGSRGCPFNCTFCYHLNKYRKRSLDSTMEELASVVKTYKINVVLFYDECIAADRERLLDLCKRMKALKDEVSWDLKWSPQLTVHNVDEETLKIMKDSGVFIASYGFESFSNTVLKSMRKPITSAMIDSAYHKTLAAGIGVQANFIFGDVAETNETARETLGWWKKNAMGQIGLAFIQPYPGSEIYKQCIKKGIIKDKAFFIKNEISTSHWYNMTDGMTDDDIQQLKKAILDATKYYRMFAKHSKRKMKENVYEFKVECPACKQVIDYKNCYVENSLNYGFPLFCRNCRHRFFVISAFQKFAYRFYSNIRFLRDLQIKYSKPKK